MAVVVGFIPTPEGHAALARASAEAQLRQVPLLVVASRDPVQNADRRAVDRLDEALETASRGLEAEGVRYQVRTFERGRLPSEDILEVAEDERAELIVIGLRRRSAVGKLLLGSHAQQVLLDASCPVLGVKAPR